LINKKAIVIGTSAGGLNAITTILKNLPTDFKIPIIVVMHLPPNINDFWIKNLNSQCKLNVKEADEKEVIKNGHVYLAPPNYHLLIEDDETLSLTVDEKVNFSRPSIDVLFESASDVYKESLIGILLTGSSKDGVIGIKKIKENRGLIIIQDPQTAEYSFMPQAALEVIDADYVLPLEKIEKILTQLGTK
jgi:two-component system chemotaxis response regulator CheB